MNGSKMLYFAVFGVAAAIAYFGWKFGVRGGYESAEYTVVEADGAFEVREYPTLMMATTDMQFPSQGGDGSFMRLFRYISGANRFERKVAMTTPVFMAPDGPQTQGRMGFVIPKETADEQIPEPVDDSVRIEERTGGRFAVMRFAGRADSEAFARAEAKLQHWVKTKWLVGEGVPEFAGYDPPWTPGPLRRNEVLLRVNRESESYVTEES